MIWDEQHEILIGLIFLVSASIAMIFVAVAGYFMAQCVFEIIDAAHQKRKEDQGRHGPNLRAKKG
jgi:hypothetical protein